MQCIQIIGGNYEALIACAKIFVLKGKLSVEEIEKVKHYCINPVDSREASKDKPETLKMNLNIPDSVEILTGFISKNEDELLKLRAEMGLAMSNADIIFCQKYFKENEKRDPSITEIRVIDTYWSDHCRHTTFATNITSVDFEDGKYKKVIEDAYKLYLDLKKNWAERKNLSV